jgi:hypothetical protein
MLHRAGQKPHSSSESSWSLASHIFSRVSQYLLLFIVVSGGRNSHSRRPSQSRSMVAIIFFPLADGSILSFLYSGWMGMFPSHEVYFLLWGEPAEVRTRVVEEPALAWLVGDEGQPVAVVQMCAAAHICCASLLACWRCRAARNVSDFRATPWVGVMIAWRGHQYVGGGGNNARIPPPTLMFACRFAH